MPSGNTPIRIHIHPVHSVSSSDGCNVTHANCHMPNSATARKKETNAQAVILESRLGDFHVNALPANMNAAVPIELIMLIIRSV